MKKLLAALVAIAFLAPTVTLANQDTNKPLTVAEKAAEKRKEADKVVVAKKKAAQEKKKKAVKKEVQK